MNKNDLLKAESHFKFGENWKAFSEHINEERIEEAKKSLIKFFGKTGLKGKTFLDIGCGSGLFSLAALLLGAKEILAVDIDKDSVATTKKVLDTFAPKAKYQCKVISVFDLDPKKHGTFDVVYSWGVLHHTGDMYTAMKKAFAMAKKEGTLAIALYTKTPLCGAWKVEKRFYAHAPCILQAFIRGLYYVAYTLKKTLSGKNMLTFVKNYKSLRGMSFSYDAHDWLGGYPYESISPQEMKTFLEKEGLKISKTFLCPPPKLGLFGTGCSEYILKRK